MGNVLRWPLVFYLALSIAFITSQRISKKSDDLITSEFILWNSGQGDLITLISKKHCWFFDLGGSHPLKKIELRELRQKCFQKTVWAFISHFDKDHIQFYKIIDQITPINRVYVAHKEAPTKASKNMLSYFARQGTELLLLSQGNAIATDHLKLQCLWPPKRRIEKKENSRSLVLTLQLESKKILLTGDLPGKFEKSISWPSQTDILKVAHHGSQSSTGKLFLEKIKSKTCLLSVGKKNRYGHPHPLLLERLRNAACSILRTDLLGTIRFLF